VAVARTLANRPQVLLADEPTAPLDSETGARVMELLGELVRADGVTVLVATHDPMIEEMADDVAHLEDGVITERTADLA
jgi:putative ABC transport system ATP-binding protein